MLYRWPQGEEPECRGRQGMVDATLVYVVPEPTMNRLVNVRRTGSSTGELKAPNVSVEVRRFHKTQFMRCSHLSTTAALASR